MTGKMQSRLGQKTNYTLPKLSDWNSPVKFRTNSYEDESEKIKYYRRKSEFSTSVKVKKKISFLFFFKNQQ